MTSAAAAGYTHNGLPYNRFGRGPRAAVVFQGLLFENKPMSGLMARFFPRMYKSLQEDFTTWIMLRKPRLPMGYTMRDMSDDYAATIREEFGSPVDVIGVSTGGSIALHFAADHPDLVRRLVIHSSAYTLSAESKDVQMRIAQMARERRWRSAYALTFGFMFARRGVRKYLARPVIWLLSLLAGSLGAPKDPSDLVVTVEAEDKHDFRDRLGEIVAPTLVVGGDRDPFYPATLFRETAEGIPNAKLIVYNGIGHPASGKRFGRDLLAFLRAHDSEPLPGRPGRFTQAPR